MSLPSALGQLPPPTRPGLSRKQKAAIVVRLLLAEGADVPLTDLPEELQAELTQQMGDLRLVNRDTLYEVAQEFAEELDSVGLAFPGGIAGALSVLDGKISARTAARLRKQTGLRQTGDPWDRLKAMDIDTLLPFAENESIEVSAVMLSMLPTNLSAQMLAKLPGDRARRIAYAITMSGDVTPDAVDRIGLSLVAQLDQRPDRAFGEDPTQRVGNILNYSPSDTRDDVLLGLEETDAEMADKVRKAIFTFAHIPERIAESDVGTAARAVDQDTLVRALVGGQQMGMTNVVDYVLGNMSKRLADGIRDEMGNIGKLRKKEAEEATSEFVAGIRELVAVGEITFKIPDEDEDE